jgi:hypothetical protein
VVVVMVTVSLGRSSRPAHVVRENKEENKQ